MITYNGTDYELKFNIGRIKLVEAVLNKSAVEALIGRGGMMPLADVEAFYSYGLKESGAETFLKAKEAAAIADGIMEAEGYTQAVLYVREAMKRDMGFLFRLVN